MINMALMTLILNLMSSVTMVLSGRMLGHKLQKNKVIWYMFFDRYRWCKFFVGFSRPWEWATFIKGDYGAIETKHGRYYMFVDSNTGKIELALADFCLK